MVRRRTPLLLLIWLLLLAVAAALWVFLRGAPPTEFGPAGRGTVAQIPDTPEARGAPPAETWTLRGSVRDTRGAALAGAHVEASGRRVDSGPDGAFEIADLPPGPHAITCWAEGHAVATRRVAPGDFAELRLARLVDVEGLVRLPDGRAAPGVTVTFRGPGDVERETVTDAAGRFALDGVPAGRARVHAAPYVDDVGGYQRSAADLVAGASDPVVVTLHEGEAIRGVVRDPAGRLVEGAECHVSAYREGHTWEPHRVTTGADGTFALAGVPRGRNSVIVETPTPERGFRYLRWFRHHREPVEGTLDVRLDEGHPIAGRLVTPRGVDFTGGRIWACRIAGEQRNSVTSGVVQPDGTFHIGGLWDAQYELRLEGASAPGDRYVLSGGYRVKSGGADVELRLAVARSVAGVVRNNAGDPVAMRTVYVRRNEIGLSRRVVTDKSGRFEVAQIPTGDVTILVWRAGRNNGAFDCGTWPAGDVDVDIRVDE